MKMDLETFQHLPTEEVARLVRAAGPKVCVFPINGTRRWFMLEHPPRPGENYASAYNTYGDVIIKRYSEIFRLFFEHGLDTLLTPLFGPDLLERGDDYVQMAMAGLAQLTTHPALLELYTDYQVRARFYGDYRKLLAPTPHAHLADLFDQVTTQTQAHNRYRLLFGVFANDAVETTGTLAVQYYIQHGHIPNKRTLVEMYYGEYIEPVSLFIGFGKFSAFDMPLVSTGNEDLYFTASPSPYLTPRQLRTILHDHLYARHISEPDYTKLSTEAWNQMRHFYQSNQEVTLGIGVMRDGIWYLQLNNE